MQSIDWNEISRRGLLVRINNEIMHPIGLAIFRDPDSGVSGGALVADDGVWQYAESVRTSLDKLVLSEISDFFAGIGQPGAPETLGEMQATLMARVESVMRDHQ
ncbi:MULTISPECIES: DUF7415 domain-containing protein [Pectobacterium]|uniref:DUF7415 domain-containing protein n=1 Tax=Pectobacterium parvum TaxID=2778550 RepID=A0AAP9LAY9_9GAMM|nr:MULTISPECIES: hypothetical protein [Pectobacterium]QHQ22846.1 hypothetical protein GMX10_01115 [Pectobacterium parvum]